jgi:phage terminase large subunit-like protein
MECQIRREKKRREWDYAMKEVSDWSACSELIRLEDNYTNR